MAKHHDRYSRVAVALHWAIAALILTNLAIGLTFPSPLPGERFSPKPLLPLHVSIGILVLLLSLFRLGWRIMHHPPPYRDSMPRWEHVLAQAGHWLFYILIIGMPLTGWMTISAHKVQKTPLKVFSLPWPHFPIFPSLPTGQVERLHDLLAKEHGLLAVWLLPALLAIHVGAVIKHHLFDQRPVLQRMLP